MLPMFFYLGNFPLVEFGLLPPLKDHSKTVLDRTRKKVVTKIAKCLLLSGKIKFVPKFVHANNLPNRSFSLVAHDSSTTF